MDLTNQLDLRWRGDTGLPKWAQCHHKGSLKGKCHRRVRVLGCEKVASQLLDLKMKEGSKSQGMWATTRSGKKQGEMRAVSSFKPSDGTQLA